MKLSAPKKVVWTIAVIVGFLGIISHFTPIPSVTEHQFWFLFTGFVLLVLGTMFKDF